jgi:hypothetical protein
LPQRAHVWDGHISYAQSATHSPDRRHLSVGLALQRGTRGSATLLVPAIRGRTLKTPSGYLLVPAIRGRTLKTPSGYLLVPAIRGRPLKTPSGYLRTRHLTLRLPARLYAGLRKGLHKL